MNYSGIDLHSNNSVVSVIDETDRVLAEKRLPNDLAKILAFLAPWRAGLAGIVVDRLGSRPVLLVIFGGIVAGVLVRTVHRKVIRPLRARPRKVRDREGETDREGTQP